MHRSAQATAWRAIGNGRLLTAFSGTTAPSRNAHRKNRPFEKTLRTGRPFACKTYNNVSAFAAARAAVKRLGIVCVCNCGNKSIFRYCNRHARVGGDAGSGMGVLSHKNPVTQSGMRSAGEDNLTLPERIRANPTPENDCKQGDGMKQWIFTLAALFLFSSAAGAGTLPPLNPDTEPDRIEWWQVEGEFGPIPTAKPGTKIGAVAKTLTNEYWRLLAEGYKHAGTDLGVEVTIGAAGNEAGQLDQLNIAETMLDDQCAAVLASPQSDSNLLPAFEKATRLGIPFINVNDAVFPSAINYIGTVARDNGVHAAKYFIERFPDGGKFAVIEGQAGVFAARQRTQGFHETLAALGGDKYEIVASVPGNWDRQLSYDKADAILIQHPDLLGFYCNNDTMALGVIEAVKDRGRLGQTLVIGTDGISAAYDSINKGELTATVDSFPVLTGMIAMDTAVRLLDGQKLPRVVATPQALITKENYSRYKDLDIDALKKNLLEDAKK